MNYVDSLNLFGVEARQTSCIKINGAPTSSTEGAVGMLAMDVDSESKDIYKCVAVNEDDTYSWEILSSGNGDEGVQVQSNWSQNDEAQPDYIQNRPFYIDRKIEEVTETILHFIDELSYSDSYDYHYKDYYKYGLIENNLYNLQITAYLEGNVVAEETLENVPAIDRYNEISINTEEFKDENGLPVGEIDVVINDTNTREWSYCQVINSPQYDEISIEITGVLNHNTYAHAPSRELLNVILAGGVDYENLGLDLQERLATKEYVNTMIGTVNDELEAILAGGVD